MQRALTRSIVRPLTRTILPVDAPAFFVDFSAGQAGAMTFARSTTATYFDAAGVLQAAASGVLRLDHHPISLARLGLLREPARTNRALWNRDLTNEAWAKSTATAAKDQVGIDGAANGASSVLATDAAATVLQTVTHTSTERAFAVYVKRLVGTGAVEITLDGGDEWTDVTELLSTSAWARASKVQTLADPVFGLRLAVSGDKVAVDYAQVEDGHCPTSAVATTTAAVTRDADAITLSGPSFTGMWNAAEGTILVEFSMAAAPPGSSFPIILSANDTTANERVAMSITETTGAINFGLTDGGVVQATCVAGSAAYAGAAMRYIGAWKLNDVRSAASGVLSTADTSATVPTVTQLQVGIQAGSGGTTAVTPIHYRRIAYWPLRLPDAALQSLTG